MGFMEENYGNSLRNVSIIRFKDESGKISYGFNYFNKEESLYNTPRTYSILKFRDVNAFGFHKDIENLCERASKKDISESKLITKLNELFEK